MTRALILPQSQITALARGAAKAGCVAEVKIGDVVIRLVPATNAQAEWPIDEPVDPANFQTLEEYEAWRKRSGAGEA